MTCPMKAKPASDVLAGRLVEPGIQHQEGTPESQCLEPGLTVIYTVP